MSNIPKSLTIVIVDDDPGHCELVMRNLRRTGVANEFVIIHRGEEALDFVHRRGTHAERPANGDILLLLDINMPGGLSGLDVLREIKGEDSTRQIPVIMLTTTDDPREINRCYDLGCSVYITKPIDPGKFMEAVTRLGLFLSVVRLPSENITVITRE
jgi:CheY-like chemotaxis protein